MYNINTVNYKFDLVARRFLLHLVDVFIFVFNIFEQFFALCLSCSIVDPLLDGVILPFCRDSVYFTLLPGFSYRKQTNKSLFWVLKDHKIVINFALNSDSSLNIRLFCERMKLYKDTYKYRNIHTHIHVRYKYTHTIQIYM